MTIEEAEPAEEQSARKRAALTLGSLVLLAVLIVVLLVTLTGHSPARRSSPLAQNVPAPAATTHAASSARPSPSSSERRSTAASSRSSASAKPSRSAAPGDTGGLLPALNAFRSSHGVHPVPGAVTQSALGCAASQGDASACPSSYFWEPVAGPDGKQVVDKIAQHPDGTGWLLDPRIKRVEIGWKAAGGGVWECAILASY